MRIIFGEFELDSELYELSCGGEPQAVEPRVFDVLLYLAERRDRVVSREELLEALWEGRTIAESTLNSTIKAARQVVGDDGQKQGTIATVSRRGYRFVAPVSGLGGASPNVAAPASRTEHRASVAVMPFAHQQDDQEMAWTSAMLGKDIGFKLARIPGFVVVSRGSTIMYVGREVTFAQVARELHANYVIDGAVHRTADSLRVSVQLVEATSGHVLWADHMKIAHGAAGGLQDEMVHEIVARIEPELNRAELATLRQRRPADLGAWALYRQATALLGLKGWSEESFAEAAELLRQAISRDPELAMAHAYLSLLLAVGHLMGLVNHDGWHEEAVAAAETALDLDGQDSDVLGYVGCSYADMGQLQRGIGMMKRAVELDPSNAQAHAGLGAAMLLRGQAEGVEVMRRGLRISPRDTRLGVWGALLARSLLSLGRAEEAIEAAEHACRCDDKLFLPRIVLAVAEITAKHPKRAAVALNDARRIRPRLAVAEIARFASPEEMAALERDGLLPL